MSPGPVFLSDEFGSLNDSVVLLLGDAEVKIAESWDVAASVMVAPSAFSIRIGNSASAKSLLAQVPPNTKFTLKVGGVAQMTGHTDGRGASNSGGATEVKIKGRDDLKFLHDTYVRAEKSFNVKTYTDLTKAVFKEVGLDPNQLRPSNDANRALKSGVPITAGTLPHRTVEQILAEANLPPGKAPVVGAVQRTLQAKLNETWMAFLRRHLDRAGLFLWAAADGTFVLSQPNGNQPPVYSLVRYSGEPRAGANVVAFDFDDDATQRHSEVIIYGRGGGKKKGRAKSKGGFDDEEMVGYGYNQPIVFRDAEVQNPVEAVFFARRKLAEERREGWRLEYTLSGHTLPSLIGPPGARAVVVEDTVVHVHDEELGLDGPFYIDTVRHQRSSSTTTIIRLSRPEDLVYGGIGSDG